MSHPARNSAATGILNPSRRFFVTTKTAMGMRLLQSERNANLFIDVLRSLVAERRLTLHDFVVMPDHVHLLIEIGKEMTIEKAMQMVKGRFSYRLKKELNYGGEVWQRGFTEEQVMDRESYEAHRAYIAQNPVKAELAASVDDFPFCFRHLAKAKAEAKCRG